MSDDESRTTLQPQNPADNKETTRQPDRSEPQSPPRKPRRKDAGFKWKEKRRDDKDVDRRDHQDTFKSRDRSRSRSPRRRDDRYGRDQRYDSRDGQRRHGSRNDGYGKDRDERRDRYDSRDDQHTRHSNNDHDRSSRNDRHDKSDKRDKLEKKSVKAPQPQQEMILVTVNDRLGTKKQIPCLPTDTVKDFKAVVAMMIGRRPHEILLKRQSERPFKDFLTLQDYGVSNNVQLDLEVDTGD